MILTDLVKQVLAKALVQEGRGGGNRVNIDGGMLTTLTADFPSACFKGAMFGVFSLLTTKAAHGVQNQQAID